MATPAEEALDRLSAEEGDDEREPTALPEPEAALDDDEAPADLDVDDDEITDDAPPAPTADATGLEAELDLHTERTLRAREDHDREVESARIAFVRSVEQQAVAHAAEEVEMSVEERKLRRAIELRDEALAGLSIAPPAPAPAGSDDTAEDIEGLLDKAHAALDNDVMDDFRRAVDGITDIRQRAHRDGNGDLFDLANEALNELSEAEDEHLAKTIIKKPPAGPPSGSNGGSRTGLGARITGAFARLG